jgi:transposase
MEERRIKGLLLRAGKLTKAEIARQLGVSRATVGAWANAIEAGDLGRLRQRKNTGWKAKLTVEQQRKLKRLLDRGALTAGYPTDRWTLVRVCALIKKEYDISYHPNLLHRVLEKLGYSVQKPLLRAAEQDEKLVKAWQAKDWLRIKKVSGSAQSWCSSMSLASLFWNRLRRSGRGKANDPSCGEGHAIGGFCLLR